MPRHANATSYGAIKGNAPNAGRVVSNPEGANGTFRKRMAFLSQRAAESNRWLRILDEASDASDADFIRAAREVWDRTHGKPAQAVDVTSGGEPIAPQTWVFGGKPVEF